MLDKTLLSIGLASVSGLRLRDVPNWKHSSATVMAQMKADLITDTQCYPSANRWYTSMDQAMGEKPADGMYTDNSFIDQMALFSSNFQGDGGQSSIAGPSDADLVNQMQTGVSGWQRPAEIDKAGAGYSLWGSQGVLPAGTNQGSLGDCWFLAACAALAENAGRIQNVFSNRGKDDQGFYLMSFYLLGDPIYVVVDDRVPISDADPNNEGYTFTSTGTRYQPFSAKPSVNGAWWQPILEKAYAKYTNTYAALNGGNEFEALRAMTGMPVETYQTSSMDQNAVYALLEDADNKNFVMTAGCHNSQYGLISGHAYSVIGVNNGNIIVRNPWGKEEYTGPGSDQSNDGQFEVPLDIWYQAFTGFDVLMYKDWTVTGLTAGVMGPEDDMSWNLYNDQAQDVVVTFDLVAKRMAEQIGGCYTDFKTLNWISQTKDQNYAATNGFTWKDTQGQNGYKMSSNIILENLPEGWYSVGTKGMFNDASTPQADFNVHVYSTASPVHLYNGDSQASQNAQHAFVGGNIPVLTDDSAQPSAPSAPSGGGGGGGGGPAPAAGCTDYAGVDAYGTGCEYYTQAPAGCGMYDTAEWSSTLACCACGGGY